jgi:hypothetical protein
LAISPTLSPTVKVQKQAQTLDAARERRAKIRVAITSAAFEAIAAMLSLEAKSQLDPA